MNKSITTRASASRSAPLQQSLSRRIGLLLFSTDIIGFAAMVLLTVFLRWGDFEVLNGSLNYLFAIGALTLFCFNLVENYELTQMSPAVRLKRILLGAFLAIALTAVFTFLFGLERSGLFGRGVLLGAIGLFAIWAGFTRAISFRYLSKLSKRYHWLVIAPNEIIEKIKPELEKNNWLGTAEYYPLSKEGQSQDERLLAKLDEDWSGVIVSNSPLVTVPMIRKLLKRRFSGTRVLDFSDFFEVTSGKIPLNELEDAKLALSPGFRLHHNSIERKVKGILDWLLATIVLFLTLPILALTTLLILIFDGRPVFYTQNRVGLNGEIFKILKFRSMKKDAEKVGGVQFAKENDDRITKIGRLIRGTRIDELPQLINILRGEMSFIGPRPERPELVEVYNKQIPYYELRHTVKAGLTGWAQVMYKYGNSNDDTVEKLQYELYYIKNYSLFLDFQILLKTLSVVFFRRGL